jgi:hypothetical protein
MSIKQFQRLVEEYIELGCDSETIVEMIEYHLCLRYTLPTSVQFRDGKHLNLAPSLSKEKRMYADCEILKNLTWRLLNQGAFSPLQIVHTIINIQVKWEDAVLRNDFRQVVKRMGDNFTGSSTLGFDYYNVGGWDCRHEDCITFKKKFRLISIERFGTFQVRWKNKKVQKGHCSKDYLTYFRYCANFLTWVLKVHSVTVMCMLYLFGDEYEDT